MVEKIKDIKPPQGIARLALRFPIWLYRVGLGGLLGTRFLMLTHTGRKSGKKRHTVLEVVRYEKAGPIFTVAVGFGPESDWFKNIHKNPNVIVQCGRKHWEMVSVFLSSEQAGDALLDYNQRHPTALRELARFMGYRIDGTSADIRALGQFISVITFHQEAISN
jgi:deazaflavin-dependent oxidoreductase (nitroreductase family)